MSRHPNTKEESFPTPLEAYEESVEYALRARMDAYEYPEMALSDAFLAGVAYAAAASIRQDTRITAYSTMRNMAIGSTITLPKYAYVSARSTASKFKDAFGALYTVKMIHKGRTDANYCEVTRLK